MKKHIGIILAAALWHATPTYPLIVAQGNSGSTTTTFDKPVYSKVFDRKTGTLYVGLAQGGGAEYALSKMGRLDGSRPTFTGIATKTLSPNVNGQPIEFLTLSQSKDPAKTKVVGVVGAGNLTISANRFGSRKVFILSPDGSEGKESPDLLEASGTPIGGGRGRSSFRKTNGIVGIAANSDFIFAAVRGYGDPFGGDNPVFQWGRDSSGIAVIRINHETLELSQATAKFGNSGITAQNLSETSDLLKIGNTALANSNPAISYSNFFTVLPMHWDEPLQRLYVGLYVNPFPDYYDVGDGARSVTVGRVNCDGALTFEKIAPNDVFLPLGDRGYIIGTASNTTGSGYPFPMRAFVKVMHASTGPSYLIVNGGVSEGASGRGSIPNNKVFALPLVDKADPDDPDQGVLANKNEYNEETRTFDLKATTSTDIVNETNPDDFWAIVGSGFLPFTATTANTTIQVSDMVVIDDTVYISTTTLATEENGVFYSQAQFDNVGKIIGWTSWERAFQDLGTGDGANINLFDVDAVTGNIWAAGDNTGSTVWSTQWDQGISPYNPNSNSLVAQLNKALPCENTAVLDLDQPTQGFDYTKHRYALFGSRHTVAFVRTSTSHGEEDHYAYDQLEFPREQQPQSVITDFSLPENFLVKELPYDAGCITSLDYSRTPTETGSTNYFFAGTTNGLYVFAKPGGIGFEVTELQELNQAPFINGSWQKAPNIEGSIIDVKTAGNALYVLVSTAQPRKGILYKIPFATTVATMFASNNIFKLAEIGTGIFHTIKQFNGMQLLPAAYDFSKEQVLLATNNGLFLSKADGGTQDVAIQNQTTTNWQLIKSDNFGSIGAVDTHSISPHHTVWPFSKPKTTYNSWCQRDSIHQLNSYFFDEEYGEHNIIDYDFIPTNFNGRTISDLPPINYFWSDGARRFFIVNPEQSMSCTANACRTNLMLLPYNNEEWNITDPLYHILHNQTLLTKTNFYWVRHIGATGILMAGTNRGIVALE